MIAGIFHQGHPRVVLTLPGIDGPLEIEFIVDTGFEGDIAVPGRIARQLAGAPDGFSERMLADGSLFKCPYYLLDMEWEQDVRTVEVLVLASNPLVGTLFLRDYLLQIEMIEDGEVTAEPL